MVLLYPYFLVQVSKELSGKLRDPCIGMAVSLEV
jgi:hypothetical protein